MLEGKCRIEGTEIVHVEGWLTELSQRVLKCRLLIHVLLSILHLTKPAVDITRIELLLLATILR